MYEIIHDALGLAATGCGLSIAKNTAVTRKAAQNMCDLEGFRYLLVFDSLSCRKNLDIISFSFGEGLIRYAWAGLDGDAQYSIYPVRAPSVPYDVDVSNSPSVVECKTSHNRIGPAFQRQAFPRRPVAFSFYTSA